LANRGEIEKSKQTSGSGRGKSHAPDDAFLRAIPPQSTELLLLLDETDTVLDAAPSVERLLGLRPDDITGAALSRQVHEDDREQLAAVLTTARSRPQTRIRFSARFLNSDNKPRDFEGIVTSYPEGGADNRLLLSAHDVTAHLRTETQLRHIVEASLQGIVVHRGGPALYTNDTTAKLIGLESKEDFMRAPAVGAFIHPDDREMVAENIRARLAGEDAPTDYEFRLQKPDGTPVWVDCRASTIMWEDEPAAIAALFDISDKKAEGEARRASEALFGKVFQVSPEIITLTRLKDGRYIDVNDRFTEILGYSREEAIGKTSVDLNIWVDEGFREEMVRHLEQDGGFRDTEAPIRTKDGEVRLLSFSAERLNFQNEDVLLVVGHDVTDRREYETTLQESKTAAELANRSKSEFLANMSHELRTPLNAIIGFAEVLEKEMFGPVGSAKYLSYAADIRTSGTHLLEIINDILDLAKLEAGKLDLHETEFSIAEVADTCTRIIGERAREAGLTIHTHMPSDRLRLHADQRLVKQVLLNLLANAVKFTPGGGSIDIEASIGNSGNCIIRVSDTGIGMSEEDIRTALTPFGQVESSFSRKHQGSGLGVPLVKSLVERHGGNLDIRSQRGAGTTVSITFPPERVRVS
jgi:PAS domain S-box-containing protein